MRPQRDLEAELDAFLGHKKRRWLRWVLLTCGLLFGLMLLVAAGAAVVALIHWLGLVLPMGSLPMLMTT